MTDDIHRLPNWPLVALIISMIAPWLLVPIFIWSTP